MKYRFLFFLLSASTFCFSQSTFTPFDSAYIYTYGGFNDDYARQIISTSDTGYIVVGTTSSFGVATTDIYIIKTDRNAVRQWSNIYGSPSIEWGYSVRETFDHGYIITGYTNQNGASGYDMYLLKITNLGAVEWTKNIGGTDWDFGYGIELTADSGFIICGKSYSFSNGGSDVYIVKTNSTGDVLWQKNYGGLQDESANAIIRDRNNDYAIIGETRSFGAGDDDIWILKINGNGDTLWTRTFGGVKFDAGYGIDTAIDGNYVAIGTTFNFNVDTASNMYFMKVDTLGNEVWGSPQGGQRTEEGRVVKTLPDGEIVSGGMTESYGLGGKAYHMLRNTSGGGFVDGASFGGTDDEEGYSVAVGLDNQIVFAGTSNSYGAGLNDVYLIRIDTFTFVGDYFLSIHEYNDSLVGIDDHAGNAHEGMFIYPNPASGFFKLKLPELFSSSQNCSIQIADLAGRILKEFPVNDKFVSTGHEIKIETGKEFSEGIYFVSVVSDGRVQQTSKLILY